MTNEELAEKMEAFTVEMRESHANLMGSQKQLSTRLDTIDLNGAASHLRKFGYFLAEHPDFMKREAESETRRVKQQIAMEWLAEIFHLKDFRKKAAWVATAILTGILLTFGSSLASFSGEVSSVIHAIGHTLFK